MQDHHVLLAEYTLGLLDGQETADAHTLLGRDTEAVKTALNWENNLLELVDLLTPVHPSWQVLQRIQSDLGHQPAPAPSSLYRKPASDDTPAPEAPVADAPEARIAARAHGRRASADKGSSRESSKRRPSVHEEPYFSVPADLPLTAESFESGNSSPINFDSGSFGAGSSKSGNSGSIGSSSISAGQDTHGDGSARAAASASNTVLGPSTLNPPSGTSREATPDHSIFNASPGPSTLNAQPGSAAAGVQGTVGAPSSPSPSSPGAVNAQASWSTPASEAAGDSLHIMGERDPRRVDHAAPEKSRKEKPSKPAAAVETRKNATSITGNIWLWRGATVLFGLIALALVFMPSTPAKPPVTVVQVAPTQAAIMQAPGQSSTPGWIVTIDPQRNVLLSPQVRTDIPSDSAVQLWTRSKTLPQPRSLGLNDPNQPVTVPAALMGDLSPDQLFEMTQEPAGGSPTASPSGPVLFIGRLVTFGKPAPAAPQAGAAADDTGNNPATGSR
jgi:anti-sigma-K factor RskA